MDEESKHILQEVGINIQEISDIGELLIPREQLLSDIKYAEIKKIIPDLKKKYSSSFMTSLQKNANNIQKWPLLNLVRQILNVYNYKMNPIRKSDGYTPEGVKKFKRFFLITLKSVKIEIKESLLKDNKIESDYEFPEKYTQI